MGNESRGQTRRVHYITAAENERGKKGQEVEMQKRAAGVIDWYKIQINMLDSATSTHGRWVVMAWTVLFASRKIQGTSTQLHG